MKVTLKLNTQQTRGHYMHYRSTVD